MLSLRNNFYLYLYSYFRPFQQSQIFCLKIKMLQHPPRRIHFVLGIMVPNSVLISIVYLHLLSTAVPAAAAHLPRAQPEVGAGRGGDQPVRGGDTLGCRVSVTMVAVWMFCEKYRFDLANLASVPTSLVFAALISINMKLE